jgi:hypothetical protein
MVFLVKYGQRRLKPVIATKVVIHTQLQRFMDKKPSPNHQTFMTLALHYGVGRVEVLKSLISFK